jgi:glycosyltransferase involved in cell wall biosynthesis
VSHTGDFSGAEVAMLRLLRALPADVERAVACPPSGPLATALAGAGVEQLPIPGTAVSFRLHPRWTTQGLIDIGRSVAALRAQVRRWRPDVVHANTTRAGLLAAPLGRGDHPRLVVQVHDIMPAGALGGVVRRVLAGAADRVVAVSQAAAGAFNAGLRGEPAGTVYISIDHERFTPDGRDGAGVRRSLGVPADVPLLGEVAQITPWKGQLAAIEALAIVRRRRADAQLALVGRVAFSGRGVRYDNGAYLEQLRDRVRRLGLEDAVHFVGQRADVPDVMAALDLLLLPSWDEPFGTAAVEAMAIGTVPLVADGGGMSEYVQDGVSGRVLPAHEPEAWGEAAIELLDDPARRAEMGARARAVAGRFTDEAYAREMLGIYAALAP